MDHADTTSLTQPSSDRSDSSDAMAGHTASVDELLLQVQLSVDRGDNADAARVNDQIAQWAQARGLNDAQVHVACFASLLAMRDGQFADAARSAAQARKLAETLNRPILLAHARCAMARVSWMTGENERALVELEAVWPVAESSGDARLKFNCENMLGVVFGNLGQFERSIEWHERAQTTASLTGLGPPQAVAAANAAGRLLDIGDRALAAGDRAAAGIHWQALLAVSADVTALAQRAGSSHAWLIMACNRSAALAQLGCMSEALLGFESVYQKAAQIGDPTTATHAMHYHVLMLQAQGDLVGARAQAQRGIEAGLACRAKTALAALYELASTIDEALSRAAPSPEDALQHMTRALESYKSFHAVRNEISLERAQLHSELMAVRLDTERARHDSQVAQAQSQVLQRANQDLLSRTESLSRDALQDPLTGLANRRRLEAHLLAAHANAVARGLPLCVAMLDLDHFKQVNDGFSHAVGDRVLQQLGAILDGHFRGADLPARLGGEEFVVVMDRVGLQQAAAICERLRLVVEAFDWSSIAPGLAVTTSIGLADIALSPDVAAGLDLIDNLLYEAKRAGRNRLAHAAPDSAPAVGPQSKGCD